MSLIKLLFVVAVAVFLRNSPLYMFLTFVASFALIWIIDGRRLSREEKEGPQSQQPYIYTYGDHTDDGYVPRPSQAPKVLSGSTT